jgi:hypothetical protein
LEEKEQSLEPEENAEPTQPMAEETERTELGEIVEEAAEARGELIGEAAEEAAAEPPSKPIKGPTGFAWLAALLLMLLGLAALVPALWNIMLATPALQGLTMEALKRYDSAMGYYSRLYQMDQQAALWTQENFSFGNTAVPSVTSGMFAFERAAMVTYVTDGPQEAASFAGQNFPEGARLPRAIQRLNAKAAVLVEAVALINAEIDPEAESPDIMAAIEAARKKDKNAAAHALIYDAEALWQAAQKDVLSEDTSKRLQALKAAKGVEPWMYESVEYRRAGEQNDYKTMLSSLEGKLARNKEDYNALLSKLKVLYLSGDKQGAEALAQKLLQNQQIADYVRVVQAELLYRDGKYSDAAKASDQAASGFRAAGNSDMIMQAIATKGAALLLEGKTEEALSLMRGAMDAPEGQLSYNFVGTLLVAAIAANDLEYYDETLNMLNMYDFALPEKLADYKAGKITLKAIYTEGMGGFES